MEAVQMFKTKDGKLFNTQEEAFQYEEAKRHDKLRSELITLFIENFKSTRNPYHYMFERAHSYFNSIGMSDHDRFSATEMFKIFVECPDLVEETLANFKTFKELNNYNESTNRTRVVAQNKKRNWFGTK